LMAHRQNEKHVNREKAILSRPWTRNLDPAAIEPKPSTNHTTPYQQPSLPLEERSTFSVDWGSRRRNNRGRVWSEGPAGLKRAMQIGHQPIACCRPLRFFRFPIPMVCHRNT
jgi:hypothetical protein